MEPEKQYQKMDRIRPKIEAALAELVKDEAENYDAHDWAAFEREVNEAVERMRLKALGRWDGDRDGW